MSNKLTIVGLGPGDEQYLTLGAIETLKNGDVVIARTLEHSAIPYLKRQGIVFENLDNLYNIAKDFDQAYQSMVEYVLGRLKQHDVVLALPGDPMIGERLSWELLKEASKWQLDIEIVPGIGEHNLIPANAGVSNVEGLKVLAAPALKDSYLDVRLPTVITEIGSQMIASETKLKLLRFYPPNLEISLMGKSLLSIELHELDMQDCYDHKTSIYIPALSMDEVEAYDFRHLEEIVALLRSPDGCPWDREQTHESLKICLIEETYEVLDAIDRKDVDNLIEELGDLIFQVVFHSQIAKEHGEFDIVSVITGVCKKMIHRHPHIFGNVEVSGQKEVLENWEAIKSEEKGLTTYTQLLRDIPSNLPALMRAKKVQKKAGSVGFDWDRIEDVFDKLEEEVAELKEAYLEEDSDAALDELGDVLFATVNVARFLNVEPELALTSTIEKFIDRFEYIEENADGNIESMSLEEMDKLWNRAKELFSKGYDV